MGVQFPFVLSTDASESGNDAKEGGAEGRETLNRGQQQEGEGLRLVRCVYFSSGRAVCRRACCAMGYTSHMD